MNINDIRDYMESLGWITQLDDDGMIIQHNDHLLIRYTYNWMQAAFIEGFDRWANSSHYEIDYIVPDITRLNAFIKYAEEN